MSSIAITKNAHSVPEFLELIGDVARVEQRVKQVAGALPSESSARLRASRELTRVPVDARKQRGLPLGIEVELGTGARKRRKRRHWRRL